MIEIKTVSGDRSLILEYAQLYAIEGKHKFIIHDYSTLRMQPYGNKLSPCMVEGYFHFPSLDGISGISTIPTFHTFFTDSRDGQKIDQFIIQHINTNENLVYRGVINESSISMNAKDPTRFNYKIIFLVDPYGGSSKKIRNVYWGSQ